MENNVWGVEKARQSIEGWRKSGLSKAAWCSLNGIAYHSFLYWCKKLNDQPVTANGFVELNLGNESNPQKIIVSGHGSLRLELPADPVLIPFLKSLLSA